ncbi:winged-helix domain-containing protein [Rossellomorea vietnamensis]|uniref:winged-helix domain-containing protein n=1 Tax=Rossellomorea vietnamensis TaxID=218284 RepID=UPI003CF18353
MLFAQNKNASRQKLKEMLNETRHTLSLQQIRTRMKELEDIGCLEIHKGRKGTEITEKG